jgi:cyanophycinase
MADPQGILIPIGGHEDKEGRKDILSRVLDETRRKDPIIEVITVATNVPGEVVDGYRDAFRALGIREVGEIYIEERDEANKDEFLHRIKRCDGVYFSGGNQLKLTTLLGGSEFLKILKDRYCNDRDFVIAGTSAGAAAMSNTMIVSGGSEDALIKGKLQLTSGLDFITNVFIDTHVTERGRFGRLMHTVASNPSVLGLGLGEDTGAIIYDGKELEIIGSGLAIIVDGNEMKYTNLTDIADGDPISIEGMKVHVLAKGKRFLLEERRLIKEKK